MFKKTNKWATLNPSLHFWFSKPWALPLIIFIFIFLAQSGPIGFSFQNDAM
jgi:hypothetical protein